MCGILLLFGISADAPEYKEMVEHARTMAKMLKHRGPDAQGEVLFSHGAVFHTRLALVDAKSGSQPLKTDDGKVLLSVNGEIFNHIKLRSELKGDHKFLTSSDCEIIMHLMRERPETFVNDLRGMFSFVMIDLEHQRVYVARDHVGICPLYMGTATGGTMRSEAFTTWDNLARDFPVPMSASVKWVSSDMRVLQDVRKCSVFDQFPPGHMFVGDMRTGEGKLIEYYRPSWKNPSFPLTDSSYPSCSFEELKQKIHDKATVAVLSHWHMRDKDVKAIIPLSGGLDSSKLVGILARESLQVGGEPIHTCSTGLKKSSARPRIPRAAAGAAGASAIVDIDPAASLASTVLVPDEDILSPDVIKAREVAKMWKTKHYEFLYTIEEVMEVLPSVVMALETCWITTVRAALCMFLMCRDLKKMGYKMVMTGSGVDEHSAGYLYFHKCPSVEQMVLELIRKVMGLAWFDNLRETKIFGWHGLECRVPFLDRDFLDFMMGEVHPALKMCGITVGGRQEKWLLRETFKEYLPPSIYARTKVQFSDGQGYSVIDALKEEAAKIVGEDELKMAVKTYPFNPPKTHEGYRIRRLFDLYFPHPCSIRTVPGGDTIACSSPAAIVWDTSFCDRADDSGRSIKDVHPVD